MNCEPLREEFLEWFAVRGSRFTVYLRPAILAGSKRAAVSWRAARPFGPYGSFHRDSSGVLSPITARHGERYSGYVRRPSTARGSERVVSRLALDPYLGVPFI